ncbi:MAG TPA: inositol phosphate phosphatase SopB [Limnobacter sp.]|nr:inositol phosphate phosphatase SopB [Limnobacter sp.]
MSTQASNASTVTPSSHDAYCRKGPAQERNRDLLNTARQLYTALRSCCGLNWALILPGKKHPAQPSNGQSELVRSESMDSGFSSLNGVHFKQIHLDAAIEVVQTLQKLRQPAGQKNPLPALLTQLNKTKSALQATAFDATSQDPANVRKTIGGKKRVFAFTPAGFRYWCEVRALVKAGRLGQPMPTHTDQVHIRVALAAYIRGALQSTGFYKGVFNMKFLDRLVFGEYVKVLHKRPWGRIELEHTLLLTTPKGQNNLASFTTGLTPAALLSPELAASYQQSGIHGVCSYATNETRHAVNLWRTSFGVKSDHDQAGCKPLFSGIRHGVHDAYGLKNDKTLREHANRTRVLEFVQACLHDKIAREPLTTAQLAGESVVDLPIVSVNLLTPKGQERSMIEHQTAAYRAMHAQELVLDLQAEPGKPAQKVRVKPSFVAFNLPVNAIALSAASDLIGIWKYSDKIMNRQALSALMGGGERPEEIGGLAAARIAEYAQQLNELQRASEKGQHSSLQGQTLNRKISMIKELVAQIHHIMHHNRHHRVGNEPYKLAVRILALANECGATPAFNCKSGKDRTGQLNVEIRDFYANYHGTGQPREPDSVRSLSDVENYRVLFAHGGDRDIQTLNTGVPGSKSQLAYYHRLMDVTRDKMDPVQGLAKWVGT